MASYVALVVPAPRGAPKEHPPTKVRVQFLAMLYMKHAAVWSLMREFIREGGLIALSEGFVDENDYLRAQCVDTFMQLARGTHPSLSDEQLPARWQSSASRR